MGDYALRKYNTTVQALKYMDNNCHFKIRRYKVIFHNKTKPWTSTDVWCTYQILKKIQQHEKSTTATYEKDMDEMNRNSMLNHLRKLDSQIKLTRTESLQLKDAIHIHLHINDNNIQTEFL